MGTIGTYTDRLVDPLRMTAEDVDIRDIAHSLALQCRFNGHCKRFYSVSQHSVILSLNVPREVALWGLLHDAAEAYLGDLVRPIKRNLWYRPDASEGLVHIETLERRIMLPICQRFGLQAAMPTPVRTADERMLATERRDLWPVTSQPWPCLDGIEPYRDHISQWDNAEDRFLRRFRELTT